MSVKDHNLAVLARLVDAISIRREASPETSYTARLLSQGIEKCAKKFGEEAVETALAAVLNDRRRLASETADALYHLVVLLEAAGLPLSDVMVELERREGTGGIAEKNSRPKV